MNEALIIQLVLLLFIDANVLYINYKAATKFEDIYEINPIYNFVIRKFGIITSLLIRTVFVYSIVAFSFFVGSLSETILAFIVGDSMLWIFDSDTLEKREKIDVMFKPLSELYQIDDDAMIFT